VLIQRRTGSVVTRYLALLAFVALIPPVVALATFLSGGAAFLSVWLLLILFGMLGVGLLAFSGAPSVRLERAGYYVLLASVFLGVVWPRYASIKLPGLPALPPARVALFVLLIFFIYLFAKRDEFRQRLFSAIHRHGLVMYPLLALLAWRLIGIAGSEIPLLSVRGVLNESVSVYLPLLAALALVRSRQDVHTVLTVFLAATGVVVLVALYEFSVGRNVFYELFEVDSAYLEQVLQDKLRGGAYRLQSTFAHPLALSEFLVLMVPVAIYMAFVDGFRWGKSLALLGLVGLSTFVIIRTGSRSGMGGFAVVLALTAGIALTRLVLRARDGVRGGLYLLGIIATVMCTVIAIYLMQEILVGRTAGERSSGLVRLLMWERGLEKAWEHPVLGWGQDLAAQVLGFIGNRGVLTIDSYYLSVLLDTGFPGLALYLIALLMAIGVFTAHGLSIRRNNLLAALMVSAVVAFALIKVVLSLHHNHGLLMLLIAVTLVSIDLSHQAESAERDRVEARRRWA
jgi:O-antigen ligase